MSFKPIKVKAAAFTGINIKIDHEVNADLLKMAKKADISKSELCKQMIDYCLYPPDDKHAIRPIVDDDDDDEEGDD